jgi:hypothetical protein
MTGDQKIFENGIDIQFQKIHSTIAPHVRLDEICRIRLFFKDDL